MKTILPPIAAACLVLIGCSGGSALRGSGSIDEETRELEPFSFVQLRGSGDIEIVHGDKPQIVLTFDNNLLTNIATRIAGPMLIISPLTGMSSRHVMKAKITTPALEGIAIDGGGTMECGPFATTNFVIRVTGRGVIKTKGTAKRLEIKINGSGEIDSTQLLTKDANLTIVGSGNVNVHATNRLSVKIVGTGKVSHTGNPKDVSQTIQGSGSIKPL